MTTPQPPRPSVELTLAPAGEPGAAGLSLTFHNTGAAPVAIESYNACADGRIEQDVFQVETETGDRVDYIGRLYKRRRATPEDYVWIEAGERLSRTVDLSTAYRLLPGDHTYRVTYAAMISYPDREGLWALDSATAATIQIARR